MGHFCATHAEQRVAHKEKRARREAAHSRARVSRGKSYAAAIVSQSEKDGRCGRSSQRLVPSLETREWTYTAQQVPICCC